MSEVDELRRAASDYRERLLERGRRIEALEAEVAALRRAAEDVLAADDPSAFAAAMRELETAAPARVEARP